MTENRNIHFLPVRFWACILVALASFCGCHTGKKAMKSPNVSPALHGAAKPPLSEHELSQEAVKEKLHENTIQYKTFSARAKLDITTPQGSQSGIAAFIRMQKDSAIWISVRPLLGIELVRVLITPDSVKMINFLKKSITLRSADSMQKLLNIPCDFNALQNLIVGNPLFQTDSLLHITTDSSGTLVAFSSREGDLTSNYLLLADNYLLHQYELKEAGASPAGTRYSKEMFDAYQIIDGRHFSTERHLAVHTDREVTVDIKFNRVDFNKPLDFPFPMPDRFNLK